MMFRITSESTTAAAKLSPGHQFPLYLLPSLKIAFRRRRHSSTTSTTTTSSTAAANNLPSLSSSPSSSAADALPSPTNTELYDYNFDAPSASAKYRQARRSEDYARLARTAPDVLRCTNCATDLAFGAQIVSKGFTGRHGRAYLVSAPLATSTPSCPGSPVSPSPLRDSSSSPPPLEAANLINITVGRNENRQLVTGSHVVADISCAVCGIKLGWKYVDAREQSQKYKVGKFILETMRVAAYRSWEDDSAIAAAGGGHPFSEAWSYASAQRRKSYPAAAAARSSFGDAAAGRKSSSSSVRTEGAEESSGGGEIVFDSDDEDECEDIFAGTWDAAAVARRRQKKASAGLRRRQQAAN